MGDSVCTVLLLSSNNLICIVRDANHTTRGLAKRLSISSFQISSISSNLPEDLVEHQSLFDFIQDTLWPLKVREFKIFDFTGWHKVFIFEQHYVTGNPMGGSKPALWRTGSFVCSEVRPCQRTCRDKKDVEARMIGLLQSTGCSTTTLSLLMHRS